MMRHLFEGDLEGFNGLLLGSDNSSVSHFVASSLNESCSPATLLPLLPKNREDPLTYRLANCHN